MNTRLIVMGASAGGLRALGIILGSLPESLPVPIVLVQHLEPHSFSRLSDFLKMHTPLRVKEAEDKESLQAGHVYTAPPNYHVLIEGIDLLTLSVDDPVHYARPSIDVLFESAADIYKEALLGVLLTGANQDGAKGLKSIQDQGGIVIVENPSTAESPAMPKAGLDATKTPHVYNLEDIASTLLSFMKDLP